MTKHPEFKQLPIARRKEILLAQGAVYRAGLSNAKEAVQAKLQSGSLLQNVLRTVAVAGFAALTSRAGRIGGVRSALPLLITGVAALSRKVRLKPLARSILLAGAVGAVAGFVIKRKKAREEARLQA
jgi:hypothetical protein